MNAETKGQQLTDRILFTEELAKNIETSIGRNLTVQEYNFLWTKLSTIFDKLEKNGQLNIKL